MIVLQDHENGEDFDIFLSGDTEGLERMTDDEMSNAQYWAAKIFETGIRVLRQYGVITGERQKVEGPKGGVH